MQGFASLRLSSELRHTDWQRDPANFIEKMTAELWESGQINEFRDAAKRLVLPALDDEEKNSRPRCVVIVFDKHLRSSAATPILFPKLRRYGTIFPLAADPLGAETVRGWATTRARVIPETYAHWYLAGTTSDQPYPANVVSLSYAGLSPTRAKILTMFNRVRQGSSASAGMVRSSGGPDGLHQALIHVTPEQMGLSSLADPVLRAFVSDLFINGSGTQLYSTTFVQWAVREALRRVQPQTVVAYFSARCRATSMDDRISHPELEPEPDYPGSLVDAEMGAYMSYLNLQRLPGSKTASFLAWHEGYGQAVLIGPGLPRDTVSGSPIQMGQLLSLMIQEP
ncbi:MAG: hypothetical protein ABI380_05625 [Edaphobacter sp.]